MLHTDYKPVYSSCSPAMSFRLCAYPQQVEVLRVDEDAIRMSVRHVWRQFKLSLHTTIKHDRCKRKLLQYGKVIEIMTLHVTTIIG